jgi:autotransporter-associated beta strand protein
MFYKFFTGRCRVSRLTAYAIAGFVVATVMLVAAPLRAASYSWAVSSGDWSNSANWGGTLPTNNDPAYVVNGGTADITQLGETCGTLSLGSGAGSGTVQMTSGSLSTVEYQYVGYSGMGTFAQSGGTNNMDYSLYLGYNVGSSGTYILSGSGYMSASYIVYVGNDGAGTFTQSGGTNHLSTGVNLGYDVGSSGTYNLSGSGLLTAQNGENVGFSGTGTFTHSGGTNDMQFYLYLGFNPGSNGSYDLSGNGLLASNGENVGGAGAGSFTQSGGTNSTGRYLKLGGYSGSNGTYNLTGGLLILSSLSQGSGSASFNFSGGTLQAGHSPSGSGIGLSTNLPMTLGAGGGGATFDSPGADGHAMTLSGSLSGPGGLTKVDSGTLTLSASNSYTGDTLVDGGTLILDYPDLVLTSNAWVDNLGSGGVLDLNFSGADSISGLYINGVAQSPGIWGGPGSGAPNTSSFLAGSGLLNVAVPEPSTLGLLAAGAIGLLSYGWRRSIARKAPADFNEPRLPASAITGLGLLLSFLFSKGLI